MKKTIVLAMGLAVALSAYSVAQDDAAAAKPKEEKKAVINPCLNHVQVTDLSGTEQGGAKNYDYFLQIKNPTDKDVYADVKFDNFPDAMRLYSPSQNNVKIKAKKSQTLRFGTGINNNVSTNTITVQVDKLYSDLKGKAAKRPVISIVNCRDKK